MLFLLQRTLREEISVSVGIEIIQYTNTYPDLPSPHRAPGTSTIVLGILHQDR
jgi:hypothetical protein